MKDSKEVVIITDAGGRAAIIEEHLVRRSEIFAALNFENISQVTLAKSQRTQNPRLASPINWDVYNWPICCKLLHFTLSEVHPQLRSVFSVIYVNLFVLALASIIKTINQILIFFVEGVFSLPKFLCCALFVALTMLLKAVEFYSAYRGFFYDDLYKLAFKVLAVYLIAAGALNAFGGFFIFNGVVRVLDYFKLIDKVSTYASLVFLLLLEFILHVVFIAMQVTGLALFLVIEYKYD